MNKRTKLKPVATKLMLAYFGKNCLLCDSPYVDGCHLYQAGVYPILASSQYTIVPLCRRHHRQLDNLGSQTTSVQFRVDFLRLHCIDEYKTKLDAQLMILKTMISELKLANKNDGDIYAIPEINLEHDRVGL